MVELKSRLSLDTFLKHGKRFPKNEAPCRKKTDPRNEKKTLFVYLNPDL